MRLFCHIPNLQTCRTHFFSPHAPCTVIRSKERRRCIHSIHCARAPESCVYSPRRCTCELCFVRRSWEQLPEVLSKLPVWEVRGYLWTLPLSNHTGPCSCFLWWLWIPLKHTHMFWDFRKATKSIKATGRIVSAKMLFPFLLGGCFSVSDVSPNFSFLHQCDFVRVCV